MDNIPKEEKDEIYREKLIGEKFVDGVKYLRDIIRVKRNNFIPS